MTISETMISVFKTKNPNPRRAKQVLKEETITYLETKDPLQSSRKNNKQNKVDNRSKPIWAQL